MFKQLSLCAAVLGALCAMPALAHETAPPDASALPEVKVRADRQGAKLKTNLVTTRKKDQSTETDLRGLFKDEPAIGIGGGNGTSQYLYIRNMGQNSVDVKVDNAYSDSQIHYHQGRHMLDPALVKIVSVQKGAGSASAGIGQTNGAVVAKTLDAADLLKNSSNPNFGGKVNLGLNSNNGHNYGVSVFGQNGMIDWLLAANRVNEKDYQGGKGYRNTVNGENKVLLSALDKTGYLAKLGVNINENHRLVLSHMHEQHKGERPIREEFAFWTEYKRPDGRIASQAPADRRMTVDNTNLEWNGKNMGFAQSATANVYRLVHGRKSADDSKNGYAGGSKNSGSTYTRVETLGANVNFDSKVHDNILLKYGVNYRTQTVKPDKIFVAGLVNQQKQDTGVYVEAISDIKDFTLTTGLRYDHFNFKAMDGKKVNAGSLNPSFGVIWQAAPGLSLSATHNYATRSPRLHDAIMSHGLRGVVSVAKGTKAEKARNTEIGFNYDNGKFAAEGSYFWQNINDAVGKSDNGIRHGDVSYAEYTNLGKIKNSGYELGGSFRHGGLTARVGVAHSKPRISGKGLNTNPEFAAFAGRTWTAGLAYRFEKPNLEVGIQHRQVEKLAKEDNFTTAKGEIVQAEKGKDGYGLTDLTVNWKPLQNNRMNVNFAVDNVFNKNYIPHAQRGDTLPGAGRAFRVGMNYTF